MERNLGRLSCCPDKEQQRNQRQRPEHRLGSERGKRARDFLKVERPEANEREEDPEDEAEVSDSVDDERFLTGIRGRFLLKPESNQQVRAKTHTLPADEHHQ